MTLIWMDGFDYYGANCPSTLRYSGSSPGQYGTAGRLGGKCLKGGIALSHSVGGSTLSALTAGFAFSTDTLPSSGGRAIYNWLNASSTVQCSLFLSQTGDLVLTRSTTITSNVLGASTSQPIQIGTWNYIEIAFTRHASAGACTVYVNGVAVLTVTGVNTGADDIQYVGWPALQSPDYIDDYYVVSGATKLGEQRVVTLRPSADTAQKDFTPNSGSNNYSRVNESPIDGDTSYVSATADGSEDLYTLDDLSFTPATITALQAIAVGKKDDATARNLSTVIHGSSDTAGTAKALTTSYLLTSDLYATNPETSSGWTVSDVNALEAGMKVTF